MYCNRNTSSLTQNCHNAKYAGVMIISERHLFKGLTDPSQNSNPDQLFDKGHAFAVSVVVGVSALLLIGFIAIAG